MRLILPAVTAALALSTSGCWLLNTAVDNALGSAASTAGNRVGQRMGESVANSVYPGGPGAAPGVGANPQYMAMYTGMIFNYAFGAGGMVVSQVPYKVGDYTHFTMSGDSGKGGSIERAHFAVDADGNQWWKVKYTDTESSETTVLEALLDKGLQKMLRLRAKFPKDAEGHEMALDQQTYFTPPRQLSPQSVQGATVGTESLTTPAGTFSARHVVFGSGNGSAEWWIAENVPGGTVKETSRQSGSSTPEMVMQLDRFGTGAVSELGSK